MVDTYVVYENIRQLLTLRDAVSEEGRKPCEKSLGIVENAAVVVEGETMVWVGETSAVPASFRKAGKIVDSSGEVWMPGLIDCHTHLIYAGNRYHDYALRCKGLSYKEVAKQGGGILSTMRATREASLESLVDKGKEHLEKFSDYGVCAVEVKSGYGLTLESEMKLLKAARALSGHRNVEVVSTFMPAHATPPEFKGRTDEYVRVMCREWIPEVSQSGLCDFFDVFVEEGYFSVDQASRLCNVALEAGLKVKLHCEQFTDLNSAKLGVDLQAVSIDHLDHISKENVRLLSKSNTVAVLLPGASLFTKTQFPPARSLLDHGAKVALSSDFNPGTCPSHNLPLMTTLACCQMGMTIPEAIVGVTLNAALAIGREKSLGSLEPKKKFRVFRFKGDSYEKLPYCFGEMRVKDGLMV